MVIAENVKYSLEKNVCLLKTKYNIYMKTQKHLDKIED